jgi:hypothetical protein
MIEPTSRDVGRDVDMHRGDGSTARGIVTGFNAEYVFVRLERQHASAPESIPVPRAALDWVEQPAADARAATARRFFENAKLSIEVLDELHWRVRGELTSPEGFLFWPSTGYFRRPDGSSAGGGPRVLIEAVRRGPDGEKAPAVKPRQVLPGTGSDAA